MRVYISRVADQRDHISDVEVKMLFDERKGCEVFVFSKNVALLVAKTPMEASRRRSKEDAEDAIDFSQLGYLRCTQR